MGRFVLLFLTFATSAMQQCMCQRLQSADDNRYDDGTGIRGRRGLASGQRGQYQTNDLGSNRIKDAGGNRIEVDPDLDYAIENAWLQGSEFEGMFEHEEGDEGSQEERERMKREVGGGKEESEEQRERQTRTRKKKKEVQRTNAR